MTTMKHGKQEKKKEQENKGQNRIKESKEVERILENIIMDTAYIILTWKRTVMHTDWELSWIRVIGICIHDSIFFISVIK